MSMTGATMVIPTVAASLLSGGCAPPELLSPPATEGGEAVETERDDDGTDRADPEWSRMWNENIGVGFD